jgi:hypothetical protein
LIHQFIFAGPKPGLSPEAFQNYWINFHAVDYAAKIRQIRQYLVATRLPLTLPRQLPFFEGVAEIWLANDAEQLASMQSAEFLVRVPTSRAGPPSGKRSALTPIRIWCARPAVSSQVRTS